MWKYWLPLAATLVTMTSARAEPAFITDSLRVALRAEPRADAATVSVLNSGTALEVLARAERMVHVRAQDAEGWVDARYVVAQAPAAAQLAATRTQAEQLQAQLNQA